MIIGYFKEYRGYRGTIEHAPIHMLVNEPKDDESKISKDLDIMDAFLIVTTNQYFIFRMTSFAYTKCFKRS